jgi:conjugal transfer/entry exclusion protein
MQSPHELQQQIILKRIAHTVGRLNEELEELDSVLGALQGLEPDIGYAQEVLRRWTTAVETERQRNILHANDTR